MKKWRILSLGVTEISLHPMLLLYMLYAFLTGHGLYMLIALLSILLHECAHAVVATLFGRQPRSIELSPLGAVMKLEDENALTPVKRGIMLLAGPAITLTLCLTAIILTSQRILSVSCGRMLFLSNLAILLLNLLPAFPLDGGRVLALLLGSVLSVPAVHRIMRWIGALSGIGLVLLNIYVSWKLGSWNLSMTFAGCCLLYSSYAALTTHAMEELRHFMERKIRIEQKGSIRISWICAVNSTPLRKLVRNLPPRRMMICLCVEPGSLKLIGSLTESEIVQQYMNSPDMTLGETLHLYPTWNYATKSDTI